MTALIDVVFVEAAAASLPRALQRHRPSLSVFKEDKRSMLADSDLHTFLLTPTFIPSLPFLSARVP